MGFFKTGFEHREKARQQEAAERKSNVQRFRLKEGEEREIILLDDDPVCFWEHTVQTGEFWTNLPCARDLFEDDPGCVLCDQGSKRYWVAVLTCLDVAGYEYRDRSSGEMVRVPNVRRLFAMKTKTQDKFARYKDRKGSLIGWKILCTRTGKYQPSVGDEFEFIERVNVFEDEQFFWRDKGGVLHRPEPFDYDKIIVPMTNAQLRYAVSKRNHPDTFPFGANASTVNTPDEGLEY